MSIFNYLLENWFGEKHNEHYTTNNQKKRKSKSTHKLSNARAFKKKQSKFWSIKGTNKKRAAIISIHNNKKKI